MKFFNNIKGIASGLYTSIKRFPAAILSSTFLMVVLVIIHETEPKTDDLSRLALAMALAIPVSLCIKLLMERKDEKRTFVHLGWYAVGAALVTSYYLFFIKDMHMVTGTRYIAFSLALYMAFLFIPFFFRRKQFEMYVVSVFTGFFTTIIYGGVMYAGLSAILFALDNLLNINILSKYYYYSFLFVSLIFAVSYFLSQVPKKDQELQPEKYPKILRILLLYIIIPLLNAYTVILYIYFGKIVVTRVWPVGPVSVSHLVLWYGVIVTVVLFFITPIKDEKNWQKNFMKFAPKVIIPLLIMMFISIGIRINAYGFTERRYFVVILGIWLLGMMIYFSFFTKKLINIIAPISLAAISIVAVFGPLSSYSFSIKSQNQRFEQYLNKYEMIKDGKIQPSTEVSKEDRAHISSIIDYFNRQHSLKDLTLLPSDFKTMDMKDILGFQYENTINYNSNSYFYFQRNTDGGLDIKDYDYLFDGRQFNNKNTSNNVYITYDYDSALLKVFYNNKEAYSTDFTKFSDALIKNHGIPMDNGKENVLPAEDMTLYGDSENLKIKVVFLSISGNAYSEQGINPKGYEFYVLVKIK